MGDESAKAKAYGADSIVVLEGLEAVRKRPAMYVGDVTDGTALVHLLWEVLDNAIDEWASGHGGPISVTLHPDGSIEVADRGRGIPVAMHRRGVSAAEVVMTVLMGGRFLDRDARHDTHKVSAGLHGVGVSAVNAVSEWLELEIRREGRVWRQRYQQGKPLGPLVVVDATERTGTAIRFKPDETIFKNITRITSEMIVHRLGDLVALHPGLTIELCEGEAHRVFHAPAGLSELVRGLCRGQPVLLDAPTQFSAEGPAEGGGRIEARVAFQWLAEAPRDQRLQAVGFACGVENRDGGTHISGVRAGTLQGVRDLLDRQGGAGDERWTPLAASIVSRMVFVVAITHPCPQFDSRTKSKLVNADVAALLRQAARGKMVALLIERPELLARLIE